MSIDRANLLGAGAPKVTFNSGEFWTRDEVIPRIAHSLTEQRASMYGRVTRTRGPRVITVTIPLFSLWQNLSILFPSTVLNPTIGSRIFGSSDLPLVLHAKNGDRLTVHNARITGLANLKLAANESIFSAAVTFTGLIRNNYDPEDANAYYTYDNSSYNEGSFALTNFLAKTWTGAWGSRTGFTSIYTQAGWDINWELGLEPDLVDGLGVVDMFLTNFGATAQCIPVGPTIAQIEGAQYFQGTGAEIGTGIHSSVDDLVITSGSASVTLKAAALTETGLAFGPIKKRLGDTIWEATRGFSTGTPQALAAIA